MIAACFPMLFFTLGDRQYIAAEIRSQAASAWEKIDTLYLHSPDAFPAACHYLGRPVKRVFRLEDELPQGKEDIYLLSYREPIVSHRTWIPVTEEVDFNLKRQLNSSLSIFKFTGSFSRTPAQETGLAPMPLRLYRGIHRE